MIILAACPILVNIHCGVSAFRGVLSLQVQLLQEIGTPREEPPVTPGRGTAKGAPAAAPPGVVDLSGLTLGPCPLVPADQAVGAQVVQLHLQSAEPLPDTLQAASVAAGITGTAQALSCMPDFMLCLIQVLLKPCAATVTPTVHMLWLLTNVCEAMLFHPKMQAFGARWCAVLQLWASLEQSLCSWRSTLSGGPQRHLTEWQATVAC